MKKTAIALVVAGLAAASVAQAAPQENTLSRFPIFATSSGLPNRP